MHVFKYQNQRIRRIGEKNGKPFKVVSKAKKKKYMKSFMTQFKIEFLLPFVDCKKMLGKMPASEVSSEF